MSGFGGFGGFGQQNNAQQQQNTGFGGFGQSTNTNTGMQPSFSLHPGRDGARLPATVHTGEAGAHSNLLVPTGFGASSTGTGFGSAQNNTGTSAFGGNTGGFGGSGGFGATQNTGFGATANKPFGATGTTGNSLFGASTTTPAANTGFGGFGASTTSNTNTGFGGGGLFGAPKPATTGFGATPAASPFGANTGTGGAFGGGTGGGFGAAGSALGGASQECQGTASVPYQPTVEKELNSGNQQVRFENICCQQPYVKFSQEELRLADYAQGRRHANSGGQAGAFGTSTGFGGFGGTQQPATGFGAGSTNTGGGLFGQTNTATNPFGQTTTPSTGFGASTTTGGGLFGQQPKPATGGLFGGTQSGFGSTPSTGFGATNTATNTGFGAQPATTSAPSLFGSTPNKPLFGAPAASTTPFGGAATTGFGATPASNPFGQTQTPAPANPFGATPAQPAASNPFGGFGGAQQQAAAPTSLFGGAPKPATTGTSLFGGQPAATGSSLFGQPAQQAGTGFGAAPAAATTGGLFGGAKPAAPATGGLFGQPAAAPAAGGGLFGGFGQQQPQQAQNTGSSLFGGAQQAKPLFGAAQPAQSGGGLFGNTQPSTGSSLFGNLGQQQQQQPQQAQQGGSLFGGSSLFGGPQQGQQQQQQQQQQGQLTTSINDPAAFGAGSMFSNLATPDLTNPGPLATPLSSLSKQKKAGIIPLYKLSPSSGSRLSTPQRRGGFGFTYSTYGTPNSASSVTSTPGGFGNSLLGASLGQNKLSKSMSTSSLRNSYNTSFNQDSILTPGAFSASPSARFNSTGSMKRLVIDRSIRADFFSPPSKEPKEQQNGILKKRVSFESSNGNGNNGRPSSSTSSPLKQVHTNVGPTPSAEEMGFLRSSRSTNGAGPRTNGTSNEPEMEQVKGKELAIVPEEGSPSTGEKPFPLAIQPDQVPGEYWMMPSRPEIEAMNRTQRQRISNFKVGRRGVATVNFDAPVDLSNVDLDKIFGTIVDLQIRAATVYPPGYPNKPPMGQGMNVPSIIQMENSWPRLDKRKMSPEHIKAQMDRHLKRLTRVPDTEFLSYDKSIGVWTFKVPHFTTYGLDYDDDDSEVGDETQDDFGQSTLSAAPDTPTPQTRTPRAVQHDQSFESTFDESVITESDPEDTFDFKKRKVFPGAFDASEVVEDDDEMEDDHDIQDNQSFLDERSVGSLSSDDVGEPMDHDESYQDNELVRIVSNEMAGSYPQPDATAEPESDYAQESFEEDVGEAPGGLMRARLRESRAAGSPLKRKLELNDDNWMDMLEQTISPQKQDREHLKQIRDMETDALLFGSPQKTLVSPVKSRVVSDGRGFATSIDLMHSLFGEPKSPAKPAKTAKVAQIPARGTGFEWPYKKKSKSSSNEDDMDEIDQQFHNSVKPSWGPTGTLVYAASAVDNQATNAIEMHGLLSQTTVLTGEDKDIRFAKFSDESTPNSLSIQKKLAQVDQAGGIPQARLSLPFKFSDFVRDRGSRHPAAIHENLVWELASILFDEIEIPDDLKGFPAAFKFLRKDNLSAFWEKVVEQASTRQITMAKSSEEKAIAALSGHRIPDACTHLLTGKDYHLATLVALLDGNESVRKNIREQLNEWNKARVLSEINQPLRAIYEILAGNVCVCDGIKGAPIEDRIDSFIMSKRFGLDWRQAFGLRLWYAISGTEELEHAVLKFAEDLQQDKESSKPFAWYVEQNISPLWDDQHLEDREDLLWGLLKLYSDKKTDLQAVLRPENSQLSPLNMRFSWQLSQALTASGKCSYGEQADEKADELTLSFAAQLTNDGHWLDAVFVLLHLSSPAARTKSIQDHLAHHVGRIGAEDGPAFTTLIDQFKIPSSWIWDAKALYMRAVLKDPKREVECLIRAGAFDEAHRTFYKVVAPTAVIEQDDATLRKLLSGFQQREGGIRDWNLGGATYADYLTLLDGEKQGEHDGQAVERLLGSLPAMLSDVKSVGFLEKVAVQEIGACVARVVVQLGKNGKGHDQSRVLRLPLTEDKYLKHTADLSVEYYRGVLAGGR
ncbi:hypothetical protein VE04_02209 [Pseudogymnoascus sp. 24MN13]|nr:hypothetical protein VE04_02209 [Pseudogymnoascus sp. 24MN13]